MHRMTRAALEVAEQAEWAAYHYDAAMAETNDSARLPEFAAGRNYQRTIARLTREQAADDVYSTAGDRRDRVGHGDSPGGGWVGHDDIDNGVHLWRRWAPDQIALEAGMAVYLARLTDRQREVVRLLFNARMTYQEVADTLTLTRSTVQTHAERAIEALRTMLLSAFVINPEEVVDVAV